MLKHVLLSLPFSLCLPFFFFFFIIYLQEDEILRMLKKASFECKGSEESSGKFSSDTFLTHKRFIALADLGAEQEKYFFSSYFSSVIE